MSPDVQVDVVRAVRESSFLAPACQRSDYRRGRSHHASNRSRQSSGRPQTVRECVTAGSDARPGTMDACLARLTDEGYRQRLVYQPRNHFWPLQWAETGLYLAASAVLAGLSFWWTRRRLT